MSIGIVTQYSNASSRVNQGRQSSSHLNYISTDIVTFSSDAMLDNVGGEVSGNVAGDMACDVADDVVGDRDENGRKRSAKDSTTFTFTFFHWK